jgi:hypothetical protein
MLHAGVSEHALDGLTDCKAKNALIGPNNRYGKHVLGSRWYDDRRMGSRDGCRTASNAVSTLNPASRPVHLGTRLVLIAPE